MPRSEVAGGLQQEGPRVAEPIRRRKRLIKIVFAVLAVFALIFLLSRAGSFLIVNAPEHSNVIVVLDGDWAKGLRLQREGYAPKVLLDVAVNRTIYGRTEGDLANEFLKSMKTTAMEICPTVADSTFAEAVDVQRCLQPLHVTSVLIVADDFDTRRTLQIFRKRLPQYHWSIAAFSAPFHDADQYWKHRAWAKTVLKAWEDFLWWKLVDQRRGDAVLR